MHSVANDMESCIAMSLIERTNFSTNGIRRSGQYLRVALHINLVKFPEKFNPRSKVSGLTTSPGENRRQPSWEGNGSLPHFPARLESNWLTYCFKEVN